jgi:hypothetical protein
MTIVFASLVSAIIMERLSLRLGLQLLPWLIAFSAASVLQYFDELEGRGDLRVYAAVQAYSALVLPLALLLPARDSRGSDYAVIFVLYALAKIFEAADQKIFSLGHIVSGHAETSFRCHSGILDSAHVATERTLPGAIHRLLTPRVYARSRPVQLQSFHGSARSFKIRYPCAKPPSSTTPIPAGEKSTAYKTWRRQPQSFVPQELKLK